MIILIDELPRTTATRKVRRAALTKYAEELLQHKEQSLLPFIISENLKLQRRFWPAVAGYQPLNYGQLSSKTTRHNSPVIDNRKDRNIFGDLPQVLSILLQGNMLHLGSELSSQHDNFRENPPSPSADSVALQWIHDGHERLVHYKDIENAADWFAASFPLNHESVVLLDIEDADPELMLAVEVAVIAKGATLYIPDKRERTSAATLLGAVHRYRLTHLLIGNNFMEQVLDAENYWGSSLLESELNWILWAGSTLKRQLFLNFTARFSITPQHVYRTQNEWHVAVDEKLFCKNDEGVIWETLKSLAVEIFSADENLLTRHSNAERIQGWNSLAFVGIVAAAEERFGIRMRPRDIMSITTLGDMERLIERRLG